MSFYFFLLTSYFFLQEVGHLLDAAGCFLFVVHEVGADEHEGGEAGVAVGIVEGDVGILVEEAEAPLVVCVEGLGAMLAMEVAEELDELVFEMADDGILEQLLCLTVLQSYVGDADAGDCDAHLLVEHGELDGEEDLSIALTDGEDLSLAACHGSADDGHWVALTYLVGGLAIDDLEVVALDDGLEALHLSVADLDGVAMLIAIGVEPLAQHLVPGGIENLSDLLLAGADEDEVMEVVAQCAVVEHGIVGLVLIIGSGDFVLDRPKLQVVEGNEMLERGQRMGVVLRGVIDLSSAAEDGPYEVGVRMTQDAPSLLTGCRAATIVFFHTRISFALSAQDCLSGLHCVGCCIRASP